jgi:hypothetical protein
MVWGFFMFFFNMFSNIFLWLSLYYPKFNEKRKNGINFFDKYNYYDKIKNYFKKKILNYFTTLTFIQLRALQTAALIVSFWTSSMAWSSIIYIIHLLKIMEKKNSCFICQLPVTSYQGTG